MRWFRSHRVLGTQAALFALLLQFALAFGHVHVTGAHASSDALITQGSFSGSDEAWLPADQGTHNPTDGLCAICVTAHLVGSAQIAHPPGLPWPLALATGKLLPASQSALVNPRRSDLRSRGPPQT